MKLKEVLLKYKWKNFTNNDLRFNTCALIRTSKQYSGIANWLNSECNVFETNDEKCGFCIIDCYQDILNKVG